MSLNELTQNLRMSLPRPKSGELGHFLKEIVLSYQLYGIVQIFKLQVRYALKLLHD